MESPAGPGTSPASLPDAAASRRWRRRRKKAAKTPAPITAKKAKILLAGLALLAVAFASGTAVLAIRGFSPAGAATSGSLAPLVMPAPERAANLPRHYSLTTDQPALLAIAQFRRRFAALLPGPVAAYPAAFYTEPGRVDLVSGSPGWVMYLGYNAPASLGDPATTMSRLMTALAGPSAAASWQVPAGTQGGSARCMVAVVGLMKMSVCGWATDRTMAALMSPARDTSANELAALMLMMTHDLQPG